MMKIAALAVCVSVTMLRASGVMPTVKYTQLSTPTNGQFGIADEAGLMRYALPKTTLILNYKKDKDCDDIPSSLELTPHAAQSDVTFAVALADKWEGRPVALDEVSLTLTSWQL